MEVIIPLYLWVMRSFLGHRVILGTLAQEHIDYQEQNFQSTCCVRELGWSSQKTGVQRGLHYPKGATEETELEFSQRWTLS